MPELIDKIKADPDFLSLSPFDKRDIIGRALDQDADYKLIPPSEQPHVRNMVLSQFPDSKPTGNGDPFGDPALAQGYTAPKPLARPLAKPSQNKPTAQTPAQLGRANPHDMPNLRITSAQGLKTALSDQGIPAEQSASVLATARDRMKKGMGGALGGAVDMQLRANEATAGQNLVKSANELTKPQNRIAGGLGIAPSQQQNANSLKAQAAANTALGKLDVETRRHGVPTKTTGNLIQDVVPYYDESRNDPDREQNLFTGLSDLVVGAADYQNLAMLAATPSALGMIPVAARKGVIAALATLSIPQAVEIAKDAEGWKKHPSAQWGKVLGVIALNGGLIHEGIRAKGDMIQNVDMSGIGEGLPTNAPMETPAMSAETPPAIVPTAQPNLVEATANQSLESVVPSHPTSEPVAPPIAQAEPVAPPETPQIAAETPNPTQPTATPKVGTAPTSAKKASMAADREALDLPQLPDAERKSWQAALNNAKPEGATALAKTILQKARALNDDETASLVVRAQQVKNQHDALMKAAATETDPVKLTETKAQVEELRSEFDTLSKATKASGTEKGRALASQKLTIGDDYSLIALASRLKQANPEKALASHETAKVEAIAAKLDAAEKRIAELEAKKPTTQPKQAGTPYGKSNRVFTEERYTTAKQRLAEKASRASAGFDPTMIADAVEIGGFHVEAGLRKFSAWSKAMRADVPGIDEDAIGDVWNKVMGDKRIAASKSRLQSTIAGLNERIAQGGDPLPKPPVVPEDFQLNALRKQRDVLRKQADDMVKAREKKTPLDYLLKWQRFSILSGATVIGKLGVAATGRITLAPIEELIGGGLRYLMPKLSAKAPREGGFNIVAEAKAFREAVSRNAVKETVDTLRPSIGANSLDLQYKDTMHENHPLFDFFGRVHSAMKTPAQLNEYHRSLEKRAAFALREGKNLDDPLVAAEIGAASYGDSLRAKLSQDNVAVSAFRAALSVLEKKGEKGGKIASSLTQTVLPIVKIPTNFAGEAAQYAGGSAYGIVRTVLAGGVKNLTPEGADAVLRAYKKQGVGLALFTLGYLGKQGIQAGGYYDKATESKKKPRDLKAGELRVFGADVPHWAAHIPALEAIQIGATFRQVMDARTGQGTVSKLATAERRTREGMIENVPFVREAKDILQSGETDKGEGRYAGQYAAGILEPQMLQQAARTFDTNRGGEPVKRKPQGFADELKMGIPGLRQQVPNEARAK